jgi:TonB family protein
MSRLPLLLFIVGALVSGQPALAADAAWSGYKWATVDVDDGGRIIAIELESGLTPAFEAALRREIGSWAFEPARIDGAAVASRTHLGVQLRAHDRGDGRAGVEVVAVSNGPRPYGKQEMRYPEDALRRRIQGAVVFTLTVTPEGTAENIVADDNAHPLLSRAALRSVRNWQFQPEQVAGQPVATRIRLPVAFCIPALNQPCHAPVPSVGAAGAPARHPDEIIALDSPVRLKADPSGRLIGS